MAPIELFLLLVGIPLALWMVGFWIWMLVDCIKHEPREGNDRIVWVLVIVFTKVLGAAIYYFVRRPQRLQPSSTGV